MSVVREELGPSLPQLLAPHWHRLTRARQVLAVLAGLAVVALLVSARFALRGDPLKTLVVDGPIAFNLVHRGDFSPASAQRGELLRMEGSLPAAPVPKETFTVRRLTVPPYRGDVSAAFLLIATRKLAELQAADPQVLYRGEGKANINFVPGYQLYYQTRRQDKLVFGKVVFLVPLPAEGEPQSREGVQLQLLAPRSGQTPSAADVGSDVLLSSPLRSFRFGTERP